MSKKFRWSIIVVALFILLVGAAGVFYFYGWFLERTERVVAGLARTGFPYRDYSIEELNRLYPQYANVDVPTVQTPEQTHRKFVDALKRENFDEAVQCCFKRGDWERVKEMLNGVKQKGQLNLMVGDLQNIEKDVVGDASATYIYSGTLKGQKVANFITFIKNSDGVWLIDSL